MNHFQATPRRAARRAASRSPALAKAHGTPLYVYSTATLTRHWKVLHGSLRGLDAHRLLRGQGQLQPRGARRSSPGSAPASTSSRAASSTGCSRPAASRGRVVFSGVGKRDDEMAFALDAGVGTINVESAGELARLSAVARRLKVRAPIALRVNPDVDPKTHPYIATGLRESKFGVPVAGRPAALRARRCRTRTSTSAAWPATSARRSPRCAPSSTRWGGCGRWRPTWRGPASACATSTWAAGWASPTATRRRPRPRPVRRRHPQGAGRLGGRGPPRAGPGAGGQRRRAADPRPLREAERPEDLRGGGRRHERPDPPGLLRRLARDRAGGGAAARAPAPSPATWSGRSASRATSWPGTARWPLPAEGDLLCVRTAGAYGFTMSSNYNSRPRAAEVLVDGDRGAAGPGQRETYPDLVRGEALPPPGRGSGSRPRRG